ncbi:MAG: IncA protein [Siphoviridae sp. ctjeG17]|jgi:hypothetical protein|nr:MAG: IncA protein [Siphoviridae sp. ctjeG17]
MVQTMENETKIIMGMLIALCGVFGVILSIIFSFGALFNFLMTISILCGVYLFTHGLFRLEY